MWILLFIEKSWAYKFELCYYVLNNIEQIEMFIFINVDNHHRHHSDHFGLKLKTQTLIVSGSAEI